VAISKKPAPGKAAPSVQVGLLDILVADRLRELRPEVVDEIAASFKTIGQLQPIVVRSWKASSTTKIAPLASYVLVAGNHRLEAARKLKWKTIAAIVIEGVDSELAEIDENLVRADLSPAERKAHIGRRKQIYEAAHPETRHGAVGRGGKSSKNEISFVEDTAQKTERGRSSIARDAKHAKDVAVLGDIPGTSLDTDSKIEALSKRPVQEQRDLAWVRRSIPTAKSKRCRSGRSRNNAIWPNRPKRASRSPRSRRRRRPQHRRRISTRHRQRRQLISRFCCNGCSWR
jgi:hypothetical protein